MRRQKPSPATEDSEEARAFLQTRLALFWKVLFFFNLAGGVLGLAGGGMVKRGPDTAITFVGIAVTGPSGGCAGGASGRAGSVGSWTPAAWYSSRSWGAS